MNTSKTYRVTSVGASSVTLTPTDVTDAAADIATVVVNF
jgi:hypothetical protein